MKYEIGSEADNFCKEFVWRGEQIKKLEIINTGLLEALQRLLQDERLINYGIITDYAQQAITKATK